MHMPLNNVITIKDGIKMIFCVYMNGSSQRHGFPLNATIFYNVEHCNIYIYKQFFGLRFFCHFLRHTMLHRFGINSAILHCRISNV